MNWLDFGAARRPTMWKLTIEDDEGKQTLLPLVREEYSLGRDEGNTIRLTERNISRKHAAVILHQGAYYLKDLGSTNGIEYNGRRIEQKRVEEGDVFHICDYELRFTYR